METLRYYHNYNALKARIRDAMIQFIAILALLLLPSISQAAVQWSLSVVAGYYFPRLDELNYILKHSGVELGPRNTEAKPSSYPVIYQGYSPDNMPEMKPASPKVGLQLHADVNPRYTVVVGGSTALFESIKKDIRPFFVGFSIPAERETRFSLLLNQIWVGGRRYWTFGLEDKGQKKGGREEQEKQSQETLPSIKQKSKIFAEVGILAVTRAYLTTDVWLHVYAPEAGFDFYKVTETGISGSGFATYIGIGGEYYIKKWLSLGMNINYTLGGINEMKFVHYFTVDPLEEDIIKPGDRVMFLDLIKGRNAPLFLDLEGLDIKGEVKMSF